MIINTEQTNERGGYHDDDKRYVTLFRSLEGCCILEVTTQLHIPTNSFLQQLVPDTVSTAGF